MRFIVLFLFISLFYFVLSKNVKTLNEAMEQEVIEIGRPKELPQGLEEEPAGDSSEEEDIKPTTSASTKKDARKTTVMDDGRKKIKDSDRIDGISPEDEEAKLERELAEIYKDTDYKDSVEETAIVKGSTNNDSAVETKEIARERSGYKFAPDSTSKSEIAKFRTSVDDIKCNRQHLSGTTPKTGTSSTAQLSEFMHSITIGLAFMAIICW